MFGITLRVIAQLSILAGILIQGQHAAAPSRRGLCHCGRRRGGPGHRRQGLLALRGSRRRAGANVIRGDRLGRSVPGSPWRAPSPPSSDGRSSRSIPVSGPPVPQHRLRGPTCALEPHWMTSVADIWVAFNRPARQALQAPGQPRRPSAAATNREL